MAKFFNDFLLPVFDPVFFQLITLGGRYEIKDREIGFILPDSGIWVRNEVFMTKQALLDYIVQKSPAVIQLGGIWPPAPPKSLSSRPLREMAKAKLINCVSEVVIDVDMTKDHVRRGLCNCATDKEICDTCWSFYMDVAQDVLEYILREIWQFKAVFKVFSGRRGFHLWILDERVHRWTSKQRSAFFNSIDRMRDATNEICPHREYIWKNILEPHAQKFPILGRWFQFLQSETTFSSCDKELSDTRWRDYCFGVLFPRMDAAITRDSTHLKKMPLQLHSSTKNLCMILGDANSKVPRFVPSKHTRNLDQLKPEYLKAGQIQILKKLKQI